VKNGYPMAMAVTIINRVIGNSLQEYTGLPAIGILRREEMDMYGRPGNGCGFTRGKLINCNFSPANKKTFQSVLIERFFFH